ncbi:MAG: sulfite exporter TauE/SafE family protein [Bacteroidetes bacterium]|nr:sulfite exporter TauE/SafE family protein [Bacteroidota bacterium]
MEQELYVLIPVFFLVALIYSSAGFGGGSSYLAILVLYPFEFTTIRIIALLCNVAVVSGSIYIFYKSGFLKIRRVLPIILLSIPFAYLGGRLKIDQEIFLIILAITLLSASLLMVFSGQTKKTGKLPKFSSGLIGAGIGFLSGAVGIGGGVFLSPVLHLTRWGKEKVIAATTSVFILVNSVAGLIGQTITNSFDVDLSLILWLLGAVLFGGQIGARLTAFKLNPIIVKRITAGLIMIVAIRILIQL